jgi:hypothetical protein
MTIEPAEVQLRLPEEPRKSIQEFPLQTFNAQGEFDIRPVDNTVIFSTSGDGNVISPDLRGISSFEGRDTQGSVPISEQLQTIWNPYKNRFRVITACLTAMANGMNDSAPGALIATMEKYVRP